MSKNQGAPGGLERVRAFANTVDIGAQTDDLADVDLAQAWLRKQGLPAVALSPEGHARLLEFRSSLRAVTEANDGYGSPEDAWKAFLASVRDVHLTVAGGAPREIALVSSDPGERAVIGELLASIYDAIRSGDWDRLKVCRDSGCAWLFYDHSKNGSGAWCSMAGCGNRNKARRRRQKEQKATA